MRLVFSPAAQREFDDARRFYESQLPGLGDAFQDEVRAGLRRIGTWPLAFPAERGTIRRALLSRFPYKLIFAVEPDHIYLIAVAHQHRRPGYWTNRPTA